jgi:uncharacterized metal-binding protein
MRESKTSFAVEIESTTKVCPVGETAGNARLGAGKIPVISCEGGCIRGEIARLAANMVAKEEAFARGCHGEIIAAPDSAIANWAKKAEKVVVIDGCFMHCHGRIMKNLISEESLRIFDALSVHGKYCDLMDADEVPEAERKETARQVADTILADLK